MPFLYRTRFLVAAWAACLVLAPRAGSTAQAPRSPVVTRDPATGRATRLVAYEALSRGNGTPEQMARRFLRKHHELLGMSASTGGLALREIWGSEHAGYQVFFTQEFAGVPVLNSDLSVAVDVAAGTVTVESNYLPGVWLVNPRPAVSEQEALRIAGEVVFPGTYRPGLEQRAQLAVYASGSERPRLLWLASMSTGGWLWRGGGAVIDARTGEVLEAQPAPREPIRADAQPSAQVTLL